MIANLILRTEDRIRANMTHVITVGTPFYGYAGQLHRWFEGVRLLNFFDVLKQPMMETIPLFPGPFVYPFLDEETFNNSANHGALASADDECPLPDYPSIDAVNEHVRADADNPQTHGSRIRYPGRTGFNRSELEYAKRQFQQLASPMNPTLLTKFHNIRGVRTKRDGEPLRNTVGSLTWDWMENFDASDQSPIDNKPALVPGDDTQPAWTARLATNMDRCAGDAPRDLLDKRFDDENLRIRMAEKFTTDRLHAIARRFLGELIRGTGPAGPEGTEDGTGLS
jgi:hypothetical protein